ncbi:hypothetical protein EMIT0P228_110005 [Pseudomonas brassicacearum]
MGRLASPRSSRRAWRGDRGQGLDRDKAMTFNILVDGDSAVASKLCSHSSDGCTTGRARSATRPPRRGR